jgi:hypothetical protein
MTDWSLSNIDIEEACKKFRIPLHKVICKDMLKSMKPKLGNYIINLADSTSPTGGTHWLALVVRKKEAMYFDSFGEIYPTEVKQFITRNPNVKIDYNTDHIQDLDDTTCGFYCIAFIHFCHRNPKATLRYNKVFV